MQIRIAMTSYSQQVYMKYVNRAILVNGRVCLTISDHVMFWWEFAISLFISFAYICTCIRLFPRVALRGVKWGNKTCELKRSCATVEIWYFVPRAAHAIIHSVSMATTLFAVISYFSDLLLKNLKQAILPNTHIWLPDHSDEASSLKIKMERY